MRTAGDPLAWVRQIDRDAVQAVELAVTRLEDLYQALTSEFEAPHGEATP